MVSKPTATSKHLFLGGSEIQSNKNDDVIIYTDINDKNSKITIPYSDGL
jgi:hypothetical protein